MTAVSSKLKVTVSTAETALVNPVPPAKVNVSPSAIVCVTAPSPVMSKVVVPLAGVDQVLSPRKKVVALGVPVAEREYVRLPDPVIGPPLPEINVELAVSTEVTVPLLSASIVIVPAPLVIVIPVPAVRVALFKVDPVEFPISNCPSV